MKQDSERLTSQIIRMSSLDVPASMPDRDEVCVWSIPLEDVRIDCESDLSLLNPDERERAQRYKVEKARTQFVTARSALRRLLGRFLGVAPLEVSIGYSGAGKPIIQPAVADLHFNVTHTDGLALMAVARRSVGIDVERLRIVSNPEGLVCRFFSAAERDAYLGLPPSLRIAAFFRGWTCKEALIKASGLSVMYLDTFDVELHPERNAGLLASRHPSFAGASWQLAAFEPAAGFVAAIALEGDGSLALDR